MGRPVLGSEDSIRAMPRDHADRLHAPPLRHRERGGGRGRRARRTSRCWSSCNAHFADLPAERAAGDAEPARYGGGEFREARDLDQVHIVLGFPSVGYGDRDYYPTLLLSTLLGGGMSSRLFQEMREKRGLVYSIYSFCAPFLDGGLFGIYAGTGESEADELMPVTLEELRKVQTTVTEAGAGAGAGAGEGQPADVAGEHRQPLRAAGPAAPGLRPGRPDRGDRGEDQRGDHEQTCSRAAARLFRATPTLAAMGPAERVPALADIADKLAA